MARRVDLVARSPHSVQRIRAAFASEAYWNARLEAFDAGSPHIDHLTTDAEGTTFVAVTMHFGREQLPKVMQRLRLPSLEVVQCERWYAIDGDEFRGEISIAAPRTPISGDGAVVLTGADAGTVLVGDATVRVNVPIIGGPISSFIDGLLANGIIDIVRVTDSWLSDHP